LRGFLRRATDAERFDGARWYPTARQIAQGFADETGYLVRTVAGVLAAISPGLRWERNLICGLALLRWYRLGHIVVPRRPGHVSVDPNAEPVVETYSYRNVLKAKRILAGEDPLAVLSGPKVLAFFGCILDAGHVMPCLDGHVANALRGTREGLRDLSASIREWERAAWIEAFRHVAGETGLPVSTVQATVWLVHKREKDGRLPF
jgi:hypothetical protein